MRKVIFLSFLLASLAIQAKNVIFDDWFTDNTLCIDYVFSGDSLTQSVSLNTLSKRDAWAGRRHNLDSLFQKGNGQIYVKDKATGEIVYCNSFSTLFQEWQLTHEATMVRKAFENSFLVPLPKKPVVVTIELTNNLQKVVASFSHTVDPTDILIRNYAGSAVPPHRYIFKGGDPKDCIDVAIVAEGYTLDEMNTFYSDATIASDALFSHSPFKEMKNRFNIVAVALPSIDSGVSVPGKKEWKNTVLGSNFNTFYSDRYLTTQNLKHLHSELATIPYEHIIILANTDTYGGGGILNSYTLTTTHNPNFRPVVVHEFGHSFCGLADEYFYDDEYSVLYPQSVEPWERNITTLVNFESKWKDMLPKKTPIPTVPSKKKGDEFTKIGVYEGAGYQSKGVYRAFDRCRMRDNAAPGFCAVCQRALKDLIRYYTE